MSLSHNQSSSIHSLDRSGRRGDMKVHSAEIFFQSFLLFLFLVFCCVCLFVCFLHEAIVRSSDMSRGVHSLILMCPSSIFFSADHGVSRPRRCPEGWFWGNCRGPITTLYDMVEKSALLLWLCGKNYPSQFEAISFSIFFPRCFSLFPPPPPFFFSCCCCCCCFVFIEKLQMFI